MERSEHKSSVRTYPRCFALRSKAAGDNSHNNLLTLHARKSSVDRLPLASSLENFFEIFFAGSGLIRTITYVHCRFVSYVLIKWTPY